LCKYNLFNPAQVCFVIKKREWRERGCRAMEQLGGGGGGGGNKEIASRDITTNEKEEEQLGKRRGEKEE
jgi:hypothetical protein